MRKPGVCKAHEQRTEGQVLMPSIGRPSMGTAWMPNPTHKDSEDFCSGYSLGPLAGGTIEQSNFAIKEGRWRENRISSPPGRGAPTSLSCELDKEACRRALRCPPVPSKLLAASTSGIDAVLEVANPMLLRLPSAAAPTEGLAHIAMSAIGLAGAFCKGRQAGELAPAYCKHRAEGRHPLWLNNHGLHHEREHAFLLTSK